MAESEEPIELEVPEEAERERLDRFLSHRLPDRSRSTLKRWIDEGRVQVSGEVRPPKYRVSPGDKIIVRPASPPPSEAIPQPMSLDIRYEDEHLLIVAKPSGLVVHPAPGHPDGTLVNGLLHHFGVRENEKGPRPGIVHRLDKDTSGLMVVARTELAKEALVKRFQAHDMERAYRAIIVGHIRPSVTFETLHGRHPVHRKRFSSRVERGKRAVTHIKLMERLQGASLVECRLETGRTHQIRVHLSDDGHPVLGDALYGRPPKDPKVRAAWGALGRQALHAYLLGFEHPVTGESLRFEMDPPPDFAACYAALTTRSIGEKGA